MAWNQPGKGNQDPWKGKDPGNEVDAFVNRLKGMFGGGNGAGGRGGQAAGSFNPLPWILALVGIWLVFNSFKLMDERERGVVLRFGEFTRIMTPGPELQVAVADRDGDRGRRHPDAHPERPGARADQGREHRRHQVQRPVPQVRSAPVPVRFARSGRDPASRPPKSAVREAVGQSTMDTVLSERAELVVMARQRLQQSLDDYQTGLVRDRIQPARRASAGRSEAGLRRRHQRARGQEPHRERGQGLRQQDRARGAR